MIVGSDQVYTTSDLRRAEVLDKGFEGPISVRDGRTGKLAMVLPSELVGRANAVETHTQLFTRVVVECQRADPSPVVLGEARFIAEWTPTQRQRFVREFAEALAVALADNDPEVVEAFLGYSSNAGRSVAPQFHSSFVTDEGGSISAHMSQG
jgi:hypothetical protein